MIQGYCIGGGAGVALCCDLRIASEDARFGIPAAKLGLAYSWDEVYPLVQLVGPSFAKEILFTGRQFSAEEALRMGLVNRVVARADLESCVDEYAEHIAANAPLTVRTAKRTIAEAFEGSPGPQISTVQRAGGCVLRQRGLCRRAQSLHGKAQARVQGSLNRRTV